MAQPERRAARNVNHPYRKNPTGSTKEGKNKSEGVGRWPLHDKRMFQWYHAQTGAITESTIRAQAIIFFQEIYEDLPLPRFSFTWMQKWRCRYSAYYTECLSKENAETSGISGEMVNDGAVLTSSPHTLATSAAGTLTEPSNKLRSAKLSGLLHDTTTIVSATHVSSFVDPGYGAPIPPIFDIPNCDDESLPTTRVIDY